MNKNPTAEKLFEVETLMQTAVATGYDIDPEEIHVHTLISPLAGEATFELVCKAESDEADVAAVIAGRGETIEEAIEELYQNAVKASAEAHDVNLSRATSPQPEQPAHRARGALRLVHSA